MAYVLTWNLRKDVETAKKLIDVGTKNTLIDWFGKKKYESLVEYSNGDYKRSYNWVKDSFIDAMDDILILLQTLANETQDNPLVQRRLKAVGFFPLEEQKDVLI